MQGLRVEPSKAAPLQTGCLEPPFSHSTTEQNGFNSQREYDIHGHGKHQALGQKSSYLT